MEKYIQIFAHSYFWAYIVTMSMVTIVSINMSLKNKDPEPLGSIWVSLFLLTLFIASYYLK